MFLLTISLMEWGAGNGAKAETLHRNAEELNEFQRLTKLRIAQIDAGAPASWEDVEHLRTTYETVKSRCPYNHLPIDYELFMGQHSDAPEFVGADGKPRVSQQKILWRATYSYVVSVWYFVTCWVLLVLAFSPLFTCLWPSVSLVEACRV